VDTSRFRFRERSPLRPRLVCTRSLEANYRVEDVLEAFTLVCQSHPQATLTIAGAGSEERRLRARAAPLGDRVNFVGRVEPVAMPALLDGDDLFVNASVVDNQPVSILEAFAAGLPVVSTAAGGIPSLVRHGETGLLTPARRPDLLAAAIIELLEHPARAASLARRARQEVEAYSWRAVRRGWEAVYVGSSL
jgi:glycosyltransferase involved in cell wall biosynthesis